MEWSTNPDERRHTDSNVKRIESNIKKLSQSVLSMQKMLNQMKTQDSPELRNQLRNIKNYTQVLAKDTSALVIDYMKVPLRADQTGVKLQREKLSDEYMTTLNAFQEVQKAAHDIEKEDVRRVKSQNVYLDPHPLDARRDNQQALQRQPQQQLQMDYMTEQELEDLEQRERDIRQLETDILDVNQIFKELGAAIHDQGAMVDSIESNVERTADSIEAGTQQLHQASGYQNKLRRRKVYIAIILTIIIIVILILIFRH